MEAFGGGMRQVGDQLQSKYQRRCQYRTLHLFGMKCASRQGAEYMSVSPVKRMGPIFCNGMDKEIRQGHIAVGEKNIQKQSLGQYIKESIQGELPIVCRLNAQTLKLWR